MTLAALLWQLPVLAAEPQAAPPAASTAPTPTAAFPAPPAAAPPAAAPPAAAPPAAAPPAAAPPPVGYSSPVASQPVAVAPSGYVLVPVGEPSEQPEQPEQPAGPSPSDHHHDGFYLRMSMGPGYLWDTVKSDPDNGLDESYRGLLFSLDVLVGGAVIPGLILGGGLWLSPGLRFRHEDVTAETQLERDYDLMLAQFGPFVDFYPNPKDGLHVQAAFNFAGLSIDSTTYDYDTTYARTVDASGFAIKAGVGYDFWLSKRWSVGVLGSLSYASLDEEEDNVTTKHRLWSPSVVASFTLN